MLKTKEEISSWLDKMEVENYIINDNLTVDVLNNGSVFINEKRLTKIPVQFNVVEGSFHCSENRLESLKGCPNIVHSNFDCSNSCLNSLEGGPKYVGGEYLCTNNKLTNLEFCPEEIGYMLDFSHNIITTLDYSPKKVGGFIFAYNNPIVDFLGFNCEFQDKFRHTTRIDVEMFRNNRDERMGTEKYEMVLTYKEMKEILDFERKKIEINNQYDDLNSNLAQTEVSTVGTIKKKKI